MKTPIDQAEAFKQQEQAGMLPGQAAMQNMQMPLTNTERAELNAYRAKAQRESDAYYQQMRGMMNHTPPMTIAEMQKAQNVNLHAIDISERDELPSFEKTGHEIMKLILRQATYFLLLMLTVGVGLAVFL